MPCYHIFKSTSFEDLQLVVCNAQPTAEEPPAVEILPTPTVAEVDSMFAKELESMCTCGLKMQAMSETVTTQHH
jgi:hypothetical protein